MMVSDIRHKWFLLLPLVVLAACGSPSNVEPPATLKSFQRLYEVRTVWQATLGPAAVGGARVRAGISGDRVVFASGEGSVKAFNIETGKEVWRQDINRKISSGVSVHAGVILVTSRNGEIYALADVDGKVLWSTSVTGEILGLPAIGSGKVIVQTVDGRLVALSLTTGKIEWSYEKNVPALSLRGDAGPIHEQGLVVAGFASGQIVGLDARNGRVFWERAVAYPSGRSDVERLVDVDVPPVISGHLLFAASYQGKLIAIDLRNGRVAWSRPISSYLPMDVDRSKLYVVNDTGIVMAIDQISGADVWIQNDLARRVSSGVTVVNDVLLVGDYEGYVHLLKTVDGKLAGRTKLGSESIIGHQLSGNRVFSNSTAGKLVAYELSSR